MTSNGLPAVGVNVAGVTEKNPGDEPLSDVVVGLVWVVVVGSALVVTGSAVVVVDCVVEVEGGPAVAVVDSGTEVDVAEVVVAKVVVAKVGVGGPVVVLAPGSDGAVVVGETEDVVSEVVVVGPTVVVGGTEEVVVAAVVGPVVVKGSEGAVVVRGSDVVVVVRGSDIVVVVREAEWPECSALPDPTVVAVGVVVPVVDAVLGVVELVVVVSVVDVVLGVAEVLGVVELVVVPVVVVPASVVVVVDVTADAATVSGAEAPDVPDGSLVISRVVVSGSTRVTLTVARPSVKLTLLPEVQSPGAG